MSVVPQKGVAAKVINLPEKSHSISWSQSIAIHPLQISHAARTPADQLAELVNRAITTPAVSQVIKSSASIPTATLAKADAPLPATHSLDKTVHAMLQTVHTTIAQAVVQTAPQSAKVLNPQHVDANLPASISLEKTLREALQSTHAAFEKAVSKPAIAATAETKATLPSLLEHVQTVHVTPVTVAASKAPVAPPQAVAPIVAETKPVAAAVVKAKPAAAVKQFAKVDVNLPSSVSLEKSLHAAAQSTRVSLEQSIAKPVVVAVAETQASMPSFLGQLNSARLVTAVPQTAISKPKIMTAVAVKTIEKVAPRKQFVAVDAHLSETASLDKALHEILQTTHAVVAKAIVKPAVHFTPLVRTDLTPLVAQARLAHIVAESAKPIMMTAPVATVAKAVTPKPLAKVNANLPETVSLDKALHAAMQSGHLALATPVSQSVSLTAMAAKTDMPSLLEQMHVLYVPATASKQAKTAQSPAPLAVPAYATQAAAALAPSVQVQKNLPPRQLAKVEASQSRPITLDKALHDAMQPARSLLAKALVKPGSLAAITPKTTDMPSLLEHVHTAHVAAAVTRENKAVLPAVRVSKPMIATVQHASLKPPTAFAKINVELPATVVLDKSLRAATQTTHAALANAIVKPTFVAKAALKINKPPVAEQPRQVTVVAVAQPKPKAVAVLRTASPVRVSTLGTQVLPLPVTIAKQETPTPIKSVKPFAKVDAHLSTRISLEKTLRAAIQEATQATDATLAKVIVKPALVQTTELKIHRPKVTVAVLGTKVLPVSTIPTRPHTAIVAKQAVVAKMPPLSPVPQVIASVLGTKILPVMTEQTTSHRALAAMNTNLPAAITVNQAFRDRLQPTSVILAKSFAKPASIVSTEHLKAGGYLTAIDSSRTTDKAAMTQKALSNVVLVAAANTGSPASTTTASPKLFERILRLVSSRHSTFIAHEHQIQPSAVMLAENTAPSVARVESDITHQAHFKSVSSLTNLPVIPVGRNQGIKTSDTLVSKKVAAQVELKPAPGSLSARAIPIPKIVTETQASMAAEAVLQTQKNARYERHMLASLSRAIEHTVKAPQMPVSSAMMGDLSSAMVAMARPQDDPTHHHTIVEQIQGSKEPLLGLRRPNTFNVAMFEKITGQKGVYDAKTRVYKLQIPRDDLNIVVNGVRLTSAMGLTSWVAFKNELDGTALKGSLVLTEEQVNPVMFAAIENGLNVTDLHNHYLWESPKVVFMHIEAVGDAKKLAKSVNAVLAKMKDSGQGNGDFPLALIDTANTTLNPARIEKILGAKGENIEGVYKIRVAKLPAGVLPQTQATGAIQGAHTAATFAGSDDGAVMDGDIALRDSQLQQVLLALHKAGISVVAIHQRTMSDDSRYVFLHYWGVGKTEELARGLRSALAVSVPKA
jgi:hypothetical protein